MSAETEKQKSDREAWIAEHGSRRLRRCVEESIECRAAYWDERLGKERPGWKLLRLRGAELVDPRSPPEGAFDRVLDPARRAKEPEAKLMFLRSVDPPRFVAVSRYAGADIVWGEWLPHRKPLADDPEFGDLE